MNSWHYRIMIILLMIFVVSCVPKKQLSYFNDIDELDPGINPRTQKTIMPFDKLYIKVLSIDPQTSQIFNSTDEVRYAGYSGGMGSIVGYLVDEKGNINFPFVGDINVGDLTLAQAASKMQKALSDYVSNT